MTAPIKAADYVADFLHRQGVTHVYEVIGGMITHLVDALHRRGQVEIVSVHHEQAASFAVDGHARISGTPQVAMATSGPGATNLLTGIGSCYFDSVPAVFITGQVNRHEMKRDKPVRQLGFQETDVVSMARPITKAAILVEDPEKLPAILEQAFRLACEGRPGPVLVDIPMDVQNTPIHAPVPEKLSLPASAEPDAVLVREALDALAAAERPLLLVGGGVHSGRAAEAVWELIGVLQIPVVGSLMAMDILPHADPLRAGFLGSYGNRWANHAIGRADCLLVLGSRLDVRQTGADTEGFREGREIYQVDVCAGEMNNRVKGCHAIEADLNDFCRAAIAQAGERPWPARSVWLEEIARLRGEYPDTAEANSGEDINPNAFMAELSAASGVARAFVADVGQHQMWAAQSLRLNAGQRFLTSGGMGAMGYALPAAIGASFAAGRSPVVMIAGDGGFQLNLQELQTVARTRLPLKLVILNNRCHGMVRQFQQSYFHERYRSTLEGYSAPDFAALAQAYGIASMTVNAPGETAAGLAALWADPREPFLLQVMLGTLTNVYPKIAYGHPLTKMEPFVQPIEMEGT